MLLIHALTDGHSLFHLLTVPTYTQSCCCCFSATVLLQEMSSGISIPTHKAITLFSFMDLHWWNKLPLVIRAGSSLSILKNLLKKTCFSWHLLVQHLQHFTMHLTWSSCANKPADSYCCGTCCALLSESISAKWLNVNVMDMGLHVILLMCGPTSTTVYESR